MKTMRPREFLFWLLGILETRNPNDFLIIRLGTERLKEVGESEYLNTPPDETMIGVARFALELAAAFTYNHDRGHVLDSLLDALRAHLCQAPIAPAMEASAVVSEPEF